MTGLVPLLERDAELARLDDLLQDGLAGDPVLALIEGPAGIGKSRLLAHAREQAARSGCRVVTARGSELERDYSFGVIHAATSRPVVASGGVTTLDDIRSLMDLVPDGVEGAIVGSALDEGRFALEDALALTMGAAA